MTKIGMRTALPRYFSSTTSPLRRPRSSASRVLIQAVGSQVTFENGLGNSCSQPLLAKRPSQIVGSGRKMISSPLAALAVAEGGGGRSEDGLGVVAAAV